MEDEEVQERIIELLSEHVYLSEQIWWIDSWKLVGTEYKGTVLIKGQMIDTPLRFNIKEVCITDDTKFQEIRSKIISERVVLKL